MLDINAKAQEIFEQNKAVGWWDDMDRCPYTTLQLVNTEIAEATEGERKDLYDDHLPHRKMGEVELADALIRTLDFGGRYGLVHNHSLCSFNFSRLHTMSIGRLHMFLTSCVVDLSDELSGAIVEGSPHPVCAAKVYTNLIDSLFAVSTALGYDIISAMDEKLEYNKQRLDHKRENRVKPGGKQF